MQSSTKKAKTLFEQARKQRSSSRRKPRLGAVLDSAADILALIPSQRDRIYVDRNPKVRFKIRSKGEIEPPVHAASYECGEVQRV